MDSADSFVPYPAYPRQRPRLRVASIGYFNYLNAGDDLLQRTIAWLFQNHEVNFHAWTSDWDHLNRADLVLVGGGSIWPDHSFFTRAQTFFDKLRKPFCVIGVSSRRKVPDCVERASLFSKRALLFHVRDRDTWRELGENPRIRSGADLFWWSPWNDDSPPSSRESGGSIALNLRGWSRDPWSPTQVVAALRQTRRPILSMPMYFGSPVHDGTIDKDDRALAESLGLLASRHFWNSEVLAQVSITVSMRFHGLLASIRAGVPAIGFAYHPKIVSLFKEIEMPELCVPLDAPNALVAAIERLEANYHKYLACIDRFRMQFIRQGHADRAALFSAVSSAAPLS